MNPFRALCRQKKVTVAIMLLSLLLQVQTVFACEMMDHSGPIKHCCCDEVVATQKEANEDQTNHSSCCDISSEIALKVSDLDADVPVTQLTTAFELPQVKLIFLLTSLWPEFSAKPIPSEIYDFHTALSNSGTETYLTTLRLRI